MKLINYRFIFSILGRITEGKIEVYRKSIDYVKLMTVFLSLLIQDRAVISCPTPSPTIFWLGRPRVSPVIIGYPTPYLESLICLFLLFKVYVRGAVAGLHQTYYHPHSFVKCCYTFCNVYLMFKGVDIIFLSAHLMVLVVVFMYY